MSKPFLIGLDMDGTITDSLRECYARTCEAWNDVYGKDYPYSYKEYKAFRHLIHVAEDFFAIPLIAGNDYVGDKVEEELKTARKNDDVARLKESFYNHRKAKQKDMNAWLDESPVYDGIREMFDEMRDMANVKPVVISSKDSDSIRALLSHHELGDFIPIYDKEVGERHVQYRTAMGDFEVEPKQMAVYDDMGEILSVARSMDITPIAAPQGYDRPENIEEFEQAYPNEFCDKIREIFGDDI